MAAQKGIDVLSFDMDPACVTKNYLINRKEEKTNILPLLLDILNPSPSLGWRGTERLSVFSRNSPDMIMALAIIHHLAISANIPLESIASHFASIAKYLIIEFVPKEDDKVKLLLLNREGIFPNYTQTKFETVFAEYFKIEQKIPSDCNNRVFYLMMKNEKPVY